MRFCHAIVGLIVLSLVPSITFAETQKSCKDVVPYIIDRVPIYGQETGGDWFGEVDVSYTPGSQPTPSWYGTNILFANKTVSCNQGNFNCNHKMIARGGPNEFGDVKEVQIEYNDYLQTGPYPGIIVTSEPITITKSDNSVHSFDATDSHADCFEDGNHRIIRYYQYADLGPFLGDYYVGMYELEFQFYAYDA